MRYDRLFTKLFCQPILVEESFRIGLEMALVAIMRGDIPQTPPMVQKIDPEVADRRANQVLEIRDNTAIIHIDGALDKNLSLLDRISFSATDLNDLDKSLARVAAGAADGSLKNLMLATDSPGGSFPGTPETAARVGALTKIMNVFAYLNNGCSGAYWIVSQCDQIYGAPSSSSGSIGVYCAILDQSRMLDDLGIRVETIQDGKLKTAGAPWKPLSESERASLQDRTNQIGEMFRAAVLGKRPGIGRDKMEGQSFLGSKALEFGLIDGLVGSLDEALAQF